MSTSDDISPATKQDVGLLLETMGKMDQRICGLEVQMGILKDDLVHQFTIIAENLRHDFFGSTNDRFVDHHRRILRLEKHVHLVD